MSFCSTPPRLSPAIPGRLLARRFGWEKRVHDIFPFSIGYAALILLGKIPVVGFLINVVLLCPAMGAVFLAIHRWRRQSAQPTLIE